MKKAIAALVVGMFAETIGATTFTAFASGATFVTSASNATPTPIASLTALCPASGVLVVTGSGESAAVSNAAGNAFIGLAYSIARNSTATDNGNVVQSSALAVFNGDANRDFLNVERVDSCTPGASHTYTLTAYATTPQTSTAGSFVWNGRLTAVGGSAVSSLAAGTTHVASAANAAPTVVTTLVVACPSSGIVAVSGSGESAAVSNFAGNAFIGLAYSIARNSTATDNGNVVQSSALAVFNGDANRDFLNVRRVDSCTPGLNYSYALTAYATTAQTGIANQSFIWNGRLTATSLPVASSAAPGTTFVASAGNATPTVVTSMNVVCPASGATVVSASGESAAVSNLAGTAFIGLAYSIARDGTATDNGNVVQSSALGKFNGDANRDFLTLQRVDGCTPGAMHNYALTAYATTPQTKTATGSFVWNGRLVAILDPDPVAGPLCGPAGCTVSAANGFLNPTLTVPPGALGSNVTISMMDVGGDPTDPAVFHVYSFSPEGTTFSTPATVNLPAPPLAAGQEAVIEVSDNGTTWTEIPTTLNNGRVVGPISHFSFCRTRTRATTVAPEQLVVTNMVQYQDLVQVKPTTGLAIPPSGEPGSCYSGDLFGVCFKLTNTSATTTITSACPALTPGPPPAGCRQLTVAPWQCYTASRDFPAAFTPGGAATYEGQHCSFTGLLIPCAEAVYNLDNFLPAGGLAPGASIWANLSFFASATPLARGTSPFSCFGSSFIGIDLLLREPFGSDNQAGIRSANDGVCVEVPQGTQFFIKSTPDTCIPGAPIGTFTCTSVTGCRVSWASLTSGTANLPTLRCVRPGSPPTPIACSQFQTGDFAYKNWLMDARF